METSHRALFLSLNRSCFSYKVDTGNDANSSCLFAMIYKHTMSADVICTKSNKLKSLIKEVNEEWNEKQETCYNGNVLTMFECRIKI